MKVLGLFDDYWPDHRSGAERMQHNILKHLVERGHECKVISRTKVETHDVDGVDVHDKFFDTEVNLIKWADVLVTSFNYSRRAMNLAKDFKKRLYIIVHNDLGGGDLMINTFTNTRAIYNSEWVAKSIKYKVPSLVFHPPVYAEDWQGKANGKFITLLNVNEIKGGDKFVKLAEMLPEYQFLGCLGSYGAAQITDSRDNITIVPNAENVADIYKQTKVLLMPSRYESYGQTQIEAGFFGIPTVYHPTPGLTESWGQAGSAIDRENLEEWAKEIKKLMSNKAYYKEQSEKAKAKAAELEAAQDWQLLENFLQQ